jgi:hypothetical protein
MAIIAATDQRATAVEVLLSSSDPRLCALASAYDRLACTAYAADWTVIERCCPRLLDDAGMI